MAKIIKNIYQVFLKELSIWKDLSCWEEIYNYLKEKKLVLLTSQAKNFKKRPSQFGLNKIMKGFNVFHKKKKNLPSKKK